MNNQTINKIFDQSKGKDHPTYEELELNADEIRRNLEEAALRADERASMRDYERESEIDYFEEMVSLAKKELVFYQLRCGIAPDENVRVQAMISHYKAALDALREKAEREKNPLRQNIFDMITAERARQDHKWGAPQENTFSEWAGILAEEFGEASAELNELNFGRGNKEKAVKELIETAAVAVATIEQYDVAAMVTAAWYAYRRNR